MTNLKSIAAIALIATVLANECATLAELTNSNGDEFLIKTTPADESNEYIMGYEVQGGEMYGYVPNSLENKSYIKTKFKIFGEKAKNGFRIMSEDYTRVFTRKSYSFDSQDKYGSQFYMLKPELEVDKSQENSFFTYKNVNNTLYGHQNLGNQTSHWYGQAGVETFPLTSKNKGNSTKDIELQAIEVKDTDETLKSTVNSKFCFRKISKQAAKCKISDVQFDRAKFVGEQCAKGKELEDGETCVATCTENGTADNNLRYTCKDGNFLPSWTTPDVSKYKNKPISCLSITPTECAGLDELINSKGQEYFIKANPDTEDDEYIMGYKLTKSASYDYLQHQTEANAENLQIKFKIHGEKAKRGFRIHSQDGSRIFSWNQWGSGQGFYMFQKSAKDTDDNFTLFTQNIDRRLGRTPNNDRRSSEKSFAPLETYIRIKSAEGTEIYNGFSHQFIFDPLVQSKFCFQKVVSSGCKVREANLTNAYLKIDTKGEVKNGKVCTAKCNTNYLGLETAYVCAAGKFVPSWITKNKPISCQTRNDVRKMKENVKAVLEDLKSFNGYIFRSKTEDTQKIIRNQIMKNFENERKNVLDVTDIEIEKELEKQTESLYS